MPKTDPVTGCTVMTHFEFIAEEAQRTGQQPEDYMVDLWNEIDEDNRRMEQSLSEVSETGPELVRITEETHKDWAETKQWYADNTPVMHRKFGRNDANELISVEYEATFDDPEPPRIRRVLYIESVECHQNTRESSDSIVAVVLCRDWKCRKVKLDTYHDSGTRIDPPDYGEELEWQEDVSTLRSLWTWTLKTLFRSKKSVT